MPAEPPRPYHHGNLRPALLHAAVEVIGHAGPAAMSLREVARRAGVTHAAAAYHFGDKAGLLTAVAAQGSPLLTGGPPQGARSPPRIPGDGRGLRAVRGQPPRPLRGHVPARAVP